MKRLFFLFVLAIIPLHAYGNAPSQDNASEAEVRLLEAPTCSFCRRIEQNSRGSIRAMDLHAHVCGNQKLTGQLLVRGFWTALWGANIYLLYRLIQQLRVTNDFRTVVTTRGLSDLIGADLTKAGSSRTIQVLAGTIASATAAYVLYQELMRVVAEEGDRETDD